MEKIDEIPLITIFVIILLTLMVIINNAKTILPIMNDDEFFVDENNIIHNTSCPYKHVPWFTKKQSKYKFLKYPEWEFCDDCFRDSEIEKLEIINSYNKDILIEFLKVNGASNKEIEDKLQRYE